MKSSVTVTATTTTTSSTASSSPHLSRKLPVKQDRKQPSKLASSTNSTPDSAFVSSPTRRMSSTIRTVPSIEIASDSSSESPSTVAKTSEPPSSPNSNASIASMADDQQENKASPRIDGEQNVEETKGNPIISLAEAPTSRNGAAEAEEQPQPRLSQQQQQQQQQQLGGGDSTVELPPPPPRRKVSSTRIALSDSARSVSGGTHSGAPEDKPPAQGWDSTIGKAGLGKTGRVINKLVGDNEALKRDIQIERLRAEESKQAAKLVEDKMERLVSDYESRLIEASVNKTLLSRKERQVESLTQTVEQERARAVAAAERERKWRDELDQTRAGASEQVERATAHATLMEGRYNVLSGQWNSRDDRAKKLREDVQAIVRERRRDDERIATLCDLCDQQDGNIRALRAEKDRIGALFEEYKRVKEESLREIVDEATKREQEQGRLLEEARETLHKLRWALQVKDNVKEAQ